MTKYQHHTECVLLVDTHAHSVQQDLMIGCSGCVEHFWLNALHLASI